MLVFFLFLFFIISCLFYFEHVRERNVHHFNLSYKYLPISALDQTGSPDF